MDGYVQTHHGLCIAGHSRVPVHIFEARLRRANIWFADWTVGRLLVDWSYAADSRVWPQDGCVDARRASRGRHRLSVVYLLDSEHGTFALAAVHSGNTREISLGRQDGDGRLHRRLVFDLQNKFE